MLAIHNALLDWRHFLEGLLEPFEIWSDHANLQYWTTAQHLTRCQARWSLHLAEFNFKRHGNVQFGAPSDAVDERLMSKEGKMEKSFLNFKVRTPVVGGVVYN